MIYIVQRHKSKCTQATNFDNMFGTLFLLLLKSGTSITIPPPPLLLQGCYFFVMSNVACLKCNNTAMKGGGERGKRRNLESQYSNSVSPGNSTTLPKIVGLTLLINQ